MMAKGKSSDDNNCSGRVLRSRKMVAKDSPIVEKPAKRMRRAISTIERGTASKVQFAAMVNNQYPTKGEIRSILSIKKEAGIRSSISTSNVPMASVRDVPSASVQDVPSATVQDVPSAKDGETLNTLVATNALLAGQLVESNKSFQQLEQKYIRVLEKSYVESFELRTKMGEQKISIQRLEMKIAEYENAKFCDDLIQLDENRKKKAYLDNITQYIAEHIQFFIF